MTERVEAASAKYAFAITPSDVTVINAEAIYVDALGDVAVNTYGGDTTTFHAVPVGTTIPVRVIKVLSTGTTATVIGLRY